MAKKCDGCGLLENECICKIREKARNREYLKTAEILELSRTQKYPTKVDRDHYENWKMLQLKLDIRTLLSKILKELKDIKKEVKQSGKVSSDLQRKTGREN